MTCKMIAAGLVMAFGLSATAWAGAVEQGAIKDGCLKSTNWPESACQCMADKAGALDDTQQAFLAATLNGDADQVTAIRATMSVQQMTEAAMFVTNTGPSCFGG